MRRSQPAWHPAVLHLRLALQAQGLVHYGAALWAEASPIDVDHVVLAALLAVVVESVLRWRAPLFGWERSVACSSGNRDHHNHCGTAANAEARRGARLRLSGAACACCRWPVRSGHLRDVGLPAGVLQESALQEQ